MVVAGVLLAHGGVAQTSGSFSVLSYNIAGLPGKHSLQPRRN